MIVITGGAGFIGSTLAKKFDGKDLMLIDKFSDAIQRKYINQVSGARLVRIQECKQILNTYKNEISCFYHLGANSSTDQKIFSETVELNIHWSQYFWDFCSNHKIPFIYASSASVYGTGKHGFKENAPTSPINYYAISKSSFDDIASQKAKDHPEATIVGLRYFNVYGSGENHKKDMASPIHKFFMQSKDSGIIRIFEGSEKFVRDFIHVADVAKITKSARHFPSGIYNVGTGVSRSFLDVATLISSHTEAKIVVIPFPDHLIGKYQSTTCSENSKINKYYPTDRLSLEDGIKKFIE